MVQIEVMNLISDINLFSNLGIIGRGHDLRLETACCCSVETANLAPRVFSFPGNEVDVWVRV